MHIASRSESGSIAEKTIYLHTESGVEDMKTQIYTEKTLLGCRAYGKKYMAMSHKGVLEKKELS